MSQYAIEWMNFVIIVIGSFGSVFALGHAADEARRERLRDDDRHR